MRRAAFLATLVVLFEGLLEPCTIFKATVDGRTLVGANEDWEEVPARVWVVAPHDGALGSVLFGFVNGWAQGGMNDQGLFFDWVAGYETGWTRSPELPDFHENISEKIMDEASTVEEALALCTTSNIDGFQAARMMLVDRVGDSAVIGFEDGALRIWRSEGGVQTLGARAATADRMLRQGGLQGVDGYSGILSACRLTGRFQTRYSNIYDLSAGTVHVYVPGSNEAGVVLDLETEFTKGSHFYDLGHIAEQLSQPILVDHKTAARVDFPSDLAEEINGTYRGAKNSFNAVRIGEEDGSHYLWPVAGQERKFRLDATSKEVLVLRSIAGSFTARRDLEGHISGLVMEQAGRTYVLEKIADPAQGSEASDGGIDQERK